MNSQTSPQYMNLNHYNMWINKQKRWPDLKFLYIFMNSLQEILIVFDTVFDALEWRELTEILDFYLCYVMKSYQTSELEKVTWPFDWIWLVSVMSRTDIWLVVKLRVRTNSELLEQKIEIIAKKSQSSGVTFWPRPWRCYVYGRR